MSYDPILELCLHPHWHPPCPSMQHGLSFACISRHMSTPAPLFPSPEILQIFRSKIHPARTPLPYASTDRGRLKGREWGRSQVNKQGCVTSINSNWWRQNRPLSEQFILICAQTSWSMTLKKFMYHLLSMAQLISEFQLCRSKALAVVRGIRSKLATILYIYRFPPIWYVFRKNAF